MDLQELLKELDQRIEFRRTNQNDPHGIDTAVMVALTEVRMAVSNAIEASKKPTYD